MRNNLSGVRSLRHLFVALDGHEDWLEEELLVEHFQLVGTGVLHVRLEASLVVGEGVLAEASGTRQHQLDFREGQAGHVLVVDLALDKVARLLIELDDGLALSDNLRHGAREETGNNASEHHTIVSRLHHYFYYLFSKYFH